MLFSEYADLAAPKGLGLTVEHHEIAEVFYQVAPQGGRPGHEWAIAYAKKNLEVFDGLAARLREERHVAKQLAESQGEAIRERQRRIDSLEHQLAAERRAHADELAKWENHTNRLQVNLDCANERDNRSQAELTRLRAVAGELETVRAAFRILSIEQPS